MTLIKALSNPRTSLHVQAFIIKIPTFSRNRKNDTARKWTRDALISKNRFETLNRITLEDDQTIELFSNALTDTAARWWKNQSELSHSGFNLDPPLPTTVSDFINQLKTKFSELQSNEIRQDAFDKITQRQGTI
jgi:hypothetical protein